MVKDTQQNKVGQLSDEELHLGKYDNETKDGHCTNCGNPIQVSLDFNAATDIALCDECAASESGQGNVSVTDADTAKEKAWQPPQITFNINVQTHYDELVKLASQQYDEDGNPFSVQQFAKNMLFAALGISMDGEVKRKKTANTDAAYNELLITQIYGLAAVKAMTAGDRAKREKQAVRSIAMEITPEQMAVARAALAIAAERAAALEDAKRLAS